MTSPIRVVSRILPPYLAACALGAAVIVLPHAADAQISMQPTPKPTVTAENEDWYQSGEPIAFGGNVYYPSGPVMHFIPNEMVPAGMFDGVTIYEQTTREPGSVIFVPLPGGLVRPYERRRTGDLAGTTGSAAPSFPVVLPSDRRAEESAAIARAPEWAERAVGTSSFPMEPTRPGETAAPHAVSSLGSIAAPATTASPAGSTLRTAGRPVGLNDVYVEYQGSRWFAAGSAVEYMPDRYTRAGEYEGFPVYTRADQPDVIYVQLVPGEPGLLTPYRKR